MKPIKFRGKRSDNGEFVFGSYCYEDYGKRDARLGILHAIIDEGGEEFIVDADSIAQLVGYDKAGNEVYEGDIFVVPCGTEIAARLFDNITPKAKLKEDAK